MSGRSGSSPDASRVAVVFEDYGVHPAVGRSARELLAAGAATGVAVTVNAPGARAEAAELVDLAARGGFDVGLQVCLTGLAPLGAMPSLAPSRALPSRNALLAEGLRGRLPVREVTAEVMRQFEAFRRFYGREPAFVTGRDLVHQVADVHKAVVKVAFRRRRPPYAASDVPVLLTCWESPLRIVRRRIGISGLAGSLAAAAMGRSAHVSLVASRWATNHGFSGLYDRRRLRMDADLFGQIAAGLPDRSVVVVRPAAADGSMSGADPFWEAREAEHRFLAGGGASRVFAELGLSPCPVSGLREQRESEQDVPFFQAVSEAADTPSQGAEE